MMNYNVIPTIDGPMSERDVMPLALYAYCVGCLPECEMWGIAAAGCASKWTVSQRNQLIKYLRQANQALAEIMHWYLMPQWIVSERVEINRPVFTEFGHLLAIGARAEEPILLNGQLVYSADLLVATIVITPATIGVQNWANITTADEIAIQHPGSELPIIPSAIVFDETAQTLTITIPRCRLVKPSVYATQKPGDGITIDSTTKFETAVDLYRVYADASNAGRMVCAKIERCCDHGCSERFGEVCVQILDRVTGLIEVRPTNGPCECKCSPEYCYAEINYYAGNPLDCDLLVKYAHALMPESPCDNCSVLFSQFEDAKKYLGDTTKAAERKRLVRVHRLAGMGRYTPF